MLSLKAATNALARFTAERSGPKAKIAVVHWRGARNASVKSTLTALHAGALVPPICAARALANRSR